jgi:hypothetical protein
MKRLFTFGCSFTLYNWPTWADIYGLEYGPLHYNWGYPGLGNRALLERLGECHARMNITKDDTVIIQWSSAIRHDYLRTDIIKTEGTNWRTHGSIFSKENAKVFDNKWIKDFWDEKAYLIHTLNFITTAMAMLEGIGCKWMMTSMNDLTKIGHEVSDRTFGGEYQGNQKLVDFWDADTNLLFYKEFIWDKNKDHWVDPIINVIAETEEMSWTFDVDPNRNIEKTYKIINGKWEEAHPTSMQHATWMLQLKDRMGEKPVLYTEQIELIKHVEEVKKNTKTFKEFEDSLRSTEWFLQRQYRGL